MGLFVYLRKSSRDGDGAMYFKRLTVEERALLDSQPDLIRNPERLFDSIKDMKKPQNLHELIELEDKKRRNIA